MKGEQFIRENRELIENSIGVDDLMSFEEFTKEYPDAMPCKDEARYSVEGTGEYEGKYVRYFGSRHVNEPEDPKESEGGSRPEEDTNMFDEIRQEFHDFSQGFPTEKIQVYVEGMYGLQSHKEEEIERIENMSEEDVIREYGEAGFAAKLAIGKGVDVESPEPESRDMVDHLLDQGFSKDEIFAYYFYLMIPQYHRMNGARTKEAFNEYITPYVEQFQHDTNWEEFDYSVDHALRIGEDIWNAPITLEDEQFYDSKVNPMPPNDLHDNTVIKKISQQYNLFRDAYMVNEMSRAFQDYDRVLAVYGNAHAVMQKSAIEKVMKGSNE